MPYLIYVISFIDVWVARQPCSHSLIEYGNMWLSVEVLIEVNFFSSLAFTCFQGQRDKFFMAHWPDLIWWKRTLDV